MAANKAKSQVAQEKKWQAQDDAYTLKRYAEIVNDSKRKLAAEKILKEEIKSAQKAINMKK
jgi:hypothetical protein